MSVIPGVVIGPPVLFPEKVEDINGTIKPIWEVVSGKNKRLPRKVGTGMFVDVRDLVGVCAGLAVVGGMELDGKRVIVVAGKGDPLAMVKALWEKYPKRLGHLDCIVRDGVVEEEAVPTFDTRDAKKLLGKGWTGYERSVRDTAESLERYLG